MFVLKVLYVRSGHLWKSYEAVGGSISSEMNVVPAISWSAQLAVQLEFWLVSVLAR